MGEDFLNRQWSVEVFANRNAWVYLFSPKQRYD